MSRAAIGFIGLGNMGCSMAVNLATKYPCDLVVYDISAKNIDNLKTRLNLSACKSTIYIADSPADVASQCSIKQLRPMICTMLPSSPHVKRVYTDSNGLLSTAIAGSLMIDSSTIDPGTAKSVAASAKEKECTYLDAPVSGGVGAAKDGVLTFMVGHEKKKDFAAATDILQNMGKNIFPLNGVGSGQIAKVCNNMMLGISMIGISETMNLGMKLGVDKKELAQIINVSSGRCWSSDTYMPVPGILDSVPSNNKWKGGFGTKLMLKDLGLAQDAAEECGAATPLGSQAQRIYEELKEQGFGDKDFGVIYKALSESGRNGFKK